MNYTASGSLLFQLHILVVLVLSVVAAFLPSPRQAVRTESQITRPHYFYSNHDDGVLLRMRTPRNKKQLSSSSSSRTRLFATGGGGVDKGWNILELTSGIVPQGPLVTIASESWKWIWKRFMTELAPQDRRTGTYQRPGYGFASHIGDADHPAQPGRYHLYTGNPCPWCHRVVLALKLLGLDTTSDEEQHVGWTVLEDNPRKASRGGWIFADTRPDANFQCQDLRQLYQELSPGYQGRCTAPLLVDKVSRTIVSNESSEIVRMLNDHVTGLLGETERKVATTRMERINLVPESLRTEIDETNEWVYRLLNNGVYRCGFSTTQTAYEAAAADVQQGLERCERILLSQPFLCGSQFTEADLRLLPTLLRFDAVYGPFFKASYARVRDYPALHAWLQRCWDIPAVSESIDLADACASYYRQLFPLNPGGIVPAPPVTAATLGLVDPSASVMTQPTVVGDKK